MGLSKGRSIPWHLLVFGSLSGAVIFFWSQQDHVTATMLAGISFAAALGYLAGAGKFLGLAASLTAVMLLATPVSRLLQPKLVEWLGPAAGGSNFLAMGISCTLILVVVSITVRILVSRILRKRPALQSANHWAGFAIGGLQGVVLVWLMAGGLLIAEPIVQHRLSDQGAAPNPASRYLAEWVVETADKTRHSPVGPYVSRFNPFHHVPRLRRLQQQMETLDSDPEAVTRLFGDAEGRGFNEAKWMTMLGIDGDSLQQTMASLWDDPEARRLIQEQGVTRQDWERAIQEHKAGR